MDRTRYLTRVGHRYYCRIRWPKEVAEFLPGGAFKMALHTSSREEAKQRLPGALQEYQNRIEAARTKLRESRPRSLSDGEIMLLVGDWARKARAMYKIDPRPGAINAEDVQARRALQTDLKDGLEIRREHLALRHYESVMPIAEGLFRRAGINIDRNDRSFWQLCETLMRAWNSLEERALAQMGGEFGTLSDDPILEELDGAVRATGTETKRTLADLIHAFEQEREARWSQSTKNAYRPVFRLLRETLGERRDIRSIDRADARRIFETVKALPVNLGKRKELKGLTVPHAVKQAKLLGLSQVGPKTVNDGYMSFISSMFAWAVDEQWIAHNPFKGLRVVDPVDPADKRKAFTLGDLTRISPHLPHRRAREARRTLRLHRHRRGRQRGARRVPAEFRPLARRGPPSEDTAIPGAPRRCRDGGKTEEASGNLLVVAVVVALLLILLW